MRFVLLLFVGWMAGACGSQGLPAGGADLAGGGGGGGGGGIGSGGDMSGRVCGALCSRCTSGACCGATCCSPGEWCDATTNTCRCGDASACPPGQICATGGPISPGDNRCGFVCCGGGNPCPL